MTTLGFDGLSVKLTHWLDVERSLNYEKHWLRFLMI